MRLVSHILWEILTTPMDCNISRSGLLEINMLHIAKDFRPVPTGRLLVWLMVDMH